MVKDADIYCSWQTSSVDVVAMPDGKFEITRNSDDYVEFELRSYNYNISKRFYFNYSDSNQYVRFVDSSLSYDGINDVKLCLNMERVTVPYDCVSLYSYTYNNNGESQKVLINSSQYTSRTCGNVIYYSLSSKWLGQNINSGSICIEAVVSNKGDEVASNSAFVNRFYGTEPFKINTMSYLVNCKGTLSGSGVYYFDNKGYYCVLDSLKEEGNNIMKITNNDGYWQYCPIKAGTTQVNAYYHYYKDGKRVDAVTNTALDIKNSYTYLWLESDGRETLKQTYSMNDFSYDEADQTIQAQQSVTLIDNNTLGLNIYWTAKDSLCLSDAVKYSVEGEPYNTWYQTLESSNVSDDDGLNHYKTTLKLGAAQLAKNIKVQLVTRPGYGDDVIKEFTTSVASYTKKLLDSTDASYAKYKPLLKSMLNYGTAAQSYFGYDTKTPANSCLADKDKTIGDIPKKDIERFNINKKFHIKGLTYYGTSLVLGDKVTMRHYFKLEEGRDISNYIAYMDVRCGENSYYSNKCKFQKKGDLYYIETTDSFKSIFERSTIEISDGNNSEYFMYSPMNYVAKAYIKGNMKPELKKLINSMYWMETEKNKLA